MAEENAYDKFLQNYILYGMSDPNGLYTQYQQQGTFIFIISIKPLMGIQVFLFK